MERRIKYALRKYLYAPLMRDLFIPNKLLNSKEDLIKAMQRGTIIYSDGKFMGYFDSNISKELRRMGAKWVNGEFKLKKSQMPMDLRAEVSNQTIKQKERIKKLDKKLSELDPEKIAGKIRTDDLFSSTLGKTDREIRKSIKKISAVPELSKEERARIADEWQNNMKRYIKGFTEEQITKLRKDIAALVVEGNRQEGIAKMIQPQIAKILKVSYNEAENKARFLARQETGLLMAKFKEVRYTKAGIQEYRWGCVAGSTLHPVRKLHKDLENKIFRWDTPPITSENGNKNNPGEDYNCRCFARPIVRFK